MCAARYMLELKISFWLRKFPMQKLPHSHLIVWSNCAHAGLRSVGDDWDRLAIRPGIHTHQLGSAAALKCDKPVIIGLVVGVVISGDGLTKSDESPLWECVRG